MLSEVVLDTTLRRVTPVSGKGALGKRRAPYRKHHLDAEPGSWCEPQRASSWRYNQASKGRIRASV